MCPMHHTREGGRTCEMRATGLDASAALLSVFAVSGVPRASVVFADLATNGRVLIPSIAAIARGELPESPPPRL